MARSYYEISHYGAYVTIPYFKNKYPTYKSAPTSIGVVLKIWDESELSEWYSKETSPYLTVDAGGGKGWQNFHIDEAAIPEFVKTAQDMGLDIKIYRGSEKKGTDLMKENVVAQELFAKDVIIKAVRDFPGGCKDQKDAFLKTLGIDETPKRLIIIEVDANDWNNNIEKVNREISLGKYGGATVIDTISERLPYTFRNAKVVDVRDKEQ